MNTLLVGSSSELSASVMHRMREFRNDVFAKRLGWSLPMLNGADQDQHDTADAKYAVSCDNFGRIDACARLVPTTGDHMSPDLFPPLLSEQEAPRDASVWQLSCFATSVREARAGRILSLSQPTLHFLDQILDFAAGQNIERLVLITSIGIERLMLRAGVCAHRVGQPAIRDGSPCVVLCIEVGARQSAEICSNEDVFETVQEACA